MSREEGEGLWVPGWEGSLGGVQRNQNCSGGMALPSVWGYPQVLCQAVSPGEVTWHLHCLQNFGSCYIRSKRC